MGRNVAIGVLLCALCGCQAGGRYGMPGEPLERLGDEIVIAGQMFHTGAPVVLWTDPGGYDAYRAHRHFDPDELRPSNPVSDDPVRYGSWRRHLPEDVAETVRQSGWSLPLVQDWVDQFVLHYDVCGTSQRCFRVLHDIRGLSVHFMLDLDGTIYQTLDVKERAWHAGAANDRSVGIEIANIGAYGDMEVLDRWYARDKLGPYVTLPESMGDGGVRTTDYVARPARPEPILGSIHDRELRQYDLTDAQYDSLIKLTATLCRALPNLAPDAPRDADGRVRMDVLTKEERAAFRGLIGHYHITESKVDPGPAFDWERLIEGVHAYLP